jgi:hypothetical protein
MADTRAEMLRLDIAFALIGACKIIRGLKKGLTEAERFAVADKVVARLMQHGDPWRLSWKLPQQPYGHGERVPRYSDDEEPKDDRG